MDDKNKGLVDNDDGDFILNESGTSVVIDPVHNDFKADDPLLKTDLQEDEKDNEDGSDQA